MNRPDSLFPNTSRSLDPASAVSASDPRMPGLGLLLLAILVGLPAPGAPLAAPSLAVTTERGKVRVAFEGVLQQAPSLAGPWIDLPQAVSPHLEDPAAGEGGRYFRARRVPTEGLFESSAVVDWVIEGPLQQHFDLAFAGLPDGIFPPRREKPYFPGSLRMGEFQLAVTLRVRGNSSLQECPFPKMKVKVSREVREGTPFEAAREIRIGTHCAEGGTGTIGRLRDQSAAYREALAYEVQALLGFPTLRVRRARIAYHDTTAGGMEPEVGWEVTREAMLLEDVEVLAERQGGRALSDEEVAALRDAGFPATLLAELRLWHALLGNWDYQVSNEGGSLWNTEVIELADGSRLPVAGDYDLASWVTGVTTPTSPRGYHPELGEVEREALYRMEQFQGEWGPVELLARAQRFGAQRAGIEAWIRSAQLDEAGRTNALRHVAAFFEALATVVRD